MQKRVSDGTVIEQGDLLLVDAEIVLNRQGLYGIYKCIVDGVYFENIRLSVDPDDDVVVEGVSNESAIQVERIRPLPRTLSVQTPLPDPEVSSGDPFATMFANYAKIYGLGDPDAIERAHQAHLAALEAAEEEESEDDPTE